MGLFNKIASSASELIVDGGMFAANLSLKMSGAEASAAYKFHSFADKRVISSANAAARNLESAQKGASKLGQARAVAGNIFANSAGGALVGGIGNAALYANRGEAIGGSYNTGDAFLTGAIGGAILGGVVGIGGAKATARAAKGNLAQAEARLAKSREKMARRGLLPFGSTKEQGDGYVFKINEGRNGGGTRLLNGPSRNNGGGNGGGGLMVSSKTPNILPGNGGAAAKIPLIGHAQNNMNTLQIPKSVKPVPVKT